MNADPWLFITQADGAIGPRQPLSQDWLQRLINDLSEGSKVRDERAGPVRAIFCVTSLSYLVEFCMLFFMSTLQI